MRFLIACSIVMIGSACAGCGAGFIPDAGDANDIAFDSVAPDAAAQVQVTLERDPTLEVQSAGIWVAAMSVTAGEEHVARVVTANDSGGPTVITGLAAGPYVIRASAFVAPGSASPQLTLMPGSTTVTSLTVQGAPAPLAVVQADFPQGNMDASVLDGSSFDATAGDVGSNDAAPMPGVTLTAPILSPDMTVTLGQLEANLQTHDSQSFDVRLTVHANDCPSGCTGLMLDTAEIRSATGGVPSGMAVVSFPTLVPPGMSVVAPVRNLPGSIGDAAGLHFAAALFPYVPPVHDAGTTPRDH